MNLGPTVAFRKEGSTETIHFALEEDGRVHVQKVLETLEARRLEVQLGPDRWASLSARADGFSHATFVTDLELVVRVGPAGGEVEALNDAWIKLNQAPSTLGKPEEWRKLQENAEGPVALCHRPPSAKAIPLGLLHPYFGRMQDVLYGRSGPAPSDKDYIAVVHLCAAAVRFYASEDDHREAMSKILSSWLNMPIGRLKISRGKKGQSPVTDGTIMVKGCPVLWLEWKLEVGTGGAEPHAESLLYFHYFLESRGLTKNLMPCLQVDIVGCTMRLSGLANVGRVASEPLTTSLHLLDMRPHDAQHMTNLARAMLALRLGVEELSAAYQNTGLRDVPATSLPYTLVNRAEPSTCGPPVFPQRSSPRAGIESSVIEAKFSASQRDLYMQTAAELEQLELSRPAWSPSAFGSGMQAGTVRLECPDRLLYLVADRKQVVKFSRSYSEPLHRELAGAGLAPQLISVDKLPGGWVAVTMEALPPPEWVTLEELMDDPSTTQQDLHAALSAATAAIRQLHKLLGGAAVWGDARPPNIMLRRDAEGVYQVKLIDFDWGGRQDEQGVVYPDFLSVEVPWADGVCAGSALKQAHDLQLLNNSANRTLERRGMQSWRPTARLNELLHARPARVACQSAIRPFMLKGHFMSSANFGLRI